MSSFFFPVLPDTEDDARYLYLDYIALGTSKTIHGPGPTTTFDLAPQDVSNEKKKTYIYLYIIFKMFNMKHYLWYFIFVRQKSSLNVQGHH